MNISTSSRSIYQLGILLPSKSRTHLALLVGLMLLGAIAEMVSVGAVVPFLAAIYDPSILLKNPIVLEAQKYIGISLGVNIRLQLTIFFVGTTVIAALLRVGIIYFSSRINAKIGHEMTIEIFKRTLYQPYAVHVARNSSEILGGLNKVEQVIAVFNAILLTLSALLVCIFIIFAIFVISPLGASIAIFGFGICYTIVSLIYRKKLAFYSKIVGVAINKRIQVAQESLGGVRDILLDHSQPIFIKKFSEKDREYREAKSGIEFIGSSPRFIIESLGMGIIAFLGYILTESGENIGASIPILGALALGAQRIMPPIQQIYNGWVTVKSNRYVLNQVRELMEQPIELENENRLERYPFLNKIQLSNVSFRYEGGAKNVLNEINLTINKGDRIGLVGETGSGKSTLVDMLMGLFNPSVGEMKVDEKSLRGSDQMRWQRNIAHVPQNIYLKDASFAENIAFGCLPEDIDLNRVRIAAEQAQIASFIDTIPGGYMGGVGEHGVRLSGGQRQRIGIARALYKNANLLVFDEATSALDNEMETSVMAELNNIKGDTTIIIIAHRLTTLSICNKIYKLERGSIGWAGSYQQLMIKNT